MSEEDLKALAYFQELYPTWWWTIGWCDVSRDFSTAPQGHSPEIVNIKDNNDPWNNGFHCDHHGTIADAIYDVMKQIKEAREILPHIKG